MSESGGSGTILAPLDVSNLQAEGLLRQGTSSGTHRLHKRRLNRSSDEEHRDIPLEIPQNDSAIQDAFASIPVYLISQETLTHVGLSASKAEQLWSTWTNWPTDGPGRETDADDGGLQVSFLDFITGHVTRSGIPDTTGEDDTEWYTCLNACGVDPKTQAAIMDPFFDDIRFDHTCLDWVRDTIKMRYAGLQDIQRASREREKEIQRVASCLGPSGGGEWRPLSGLQQQSMAGISANVWGSACAAAACNAPEYMVLYKGIDQAHIEGMFDVDGNMDQISKLTSLPPSDFNNKAVMYYFTPNRKVAEYYAGYAKRRANCESVVMVVLCIPNAAIQSLTEPEIQHLHWPSDNWKQMIWNCRRNNNLPKRLRVYKEATLIIGSISRKPNNVYHRLDTWEGVTERYLLKVKPDGRSGADGTIATQYAIQGLEKGEDWLLENGGKDIKVFPYSHAALESLIAENRD
ncbi:hypothetical protein B0T25DRAFT_544093 [Lasiosphaeria hispida]|uniref:Uncharacterized protein n=1 Tax=Lasiosphaeria hispida TaxID=260671 RepID=A0AAJ0ME98_9PEZI|nr:hypothetical protein B0T25DRAFT_544093 [Lasiosphaeria hispida]